MKQQPLCSYSKRETQSCWQFPVCFLSSPCYYQLSFQITSPADQKRPRPTTRASLRMYCTELVGINSKKHFIDFYTASFHGINPDFSVSSNCSVPGQVSDFCLIQLPFPNVYIPSSFTWSISYDELLIPKQTDNME